MRLNQQTQAIIRSTVRDIIGPDATVLVFGSRVVDSARGGDIDLLVQTPMPVPQRQRKILKLTARLQRRLGDQPIDILLLDPGTPRQPVHERALRQGIPL